MFGKPLYFGSAGLPDTTTPKKIQQYHIDTQLGCVLWSQLTHCVLLTEQMRIVDKRYELLLNRLSDGECTDEDYELLCTRVIGNPTLTTSDLSCFATSPVIVPGNDLRAQLNSAYIRQQSQETSVQLLISHAQDTCKAVDLTLNPKLRSSLLSLPSTKCGGLPGICELLPGSPVVLTTNISVPL